ncbi:hypothetical protein LOK49_LG04G00364 [Camellia lanceoleosa]|uniref:Uncharacterized protein n=1 Tax=Camellia lanceoleosa TaxID=1840588 RepID=A0ACC0HX96_9ERIC|nr:hypothetical protein LOK49_LG04G00364 [Camellia lanceoleosa]
MVAVKDGNENDGGSTWVVDLEKDEKKIISKKSLDSVFTLVSKGVSLESPIGSIEFSLISEIFEDHQLGESAEVNSNFTSQSNLTFSSFYFLMSAKRTVSSVQPDLKSKKSRIQEDYIYILYFHEEGPIGYAMYKIDVSAFSIDENAKNNVRAITSDLNYREPIILGLWSLLRWALEFLR